MPEFDNHQGDRIKKYWRRLWDNPKLLYRAVIILLLAGLFYGFWQLPHTISGPFVRNQAVKSSVEQEVNDELAEITKLRSRDADSDGLSDYDELYVYGTSPYLEDTDSDGYADKTEIQTGNNPNCPAGQKCLATVADTAESQVTTEPSFPDTNPLDVSNEELRQILLESGIDPTLLSQVDDATLRQMYNEVITEIQLEQTGVGGVNSGSSASQGDTLLQLQNLSADEVRQLLLQSGVDQEELDAVSDDELMLFYQEILNQELSQ